ncbi:hypothetical protein [Glaciecola sp. SC05]|uniref:hypothetical protein n=1 Tax=Glaciecola sp. SC05 TaxID=1987355 RepID=UPI003527A854
MPNGAWDDLSENVKAVLRQSKALRKSGNEQEAKALLESILDEYSAGNIEHSIGNLYLNNTGDIPTNRELGLEWILKAAMKKPSLFVYLGSQKEFDSLAVWTYGLSRGCTGCFRSIEIRLDYLQKTSKNKETFNNIISQDLMLKYSIFALEAGVAQALPTLSKLISEAEKYPERYNKESHALIATMTNEAKRHAGEALIFGLPKAVKTISKSGFIPQRIKTAALKIENNDPQTALKLLAVNSETSEFLPVVINKLMNTYQDIDANNTAFNTLVLKTVNAGDPRHAATAAAIQKYRLNRFARSGNGHRTINGGGYGYASAETYQRFGEYNYTITSATTLFLNKPRPKGSAIDIYNSASKCVFDALKYDLDFAKASAVFRCKNLVNSVWETSSTALDIGGLNEEMYRHLIQQVKITKMEMNEKEIREEAERLNARTLKIGKEMIQRERDSYKRLGLKPKPFENYFELMEKASSIYENAKLSASFERPNFIRNRPITATDMQAFYDDYLRRKKDIEDGTAGKYFGPKEEAEICNIWSFKLLPVCDNTN